MEKLKLNNRKLTDKFIEYKKNYKALDKKYKVRYHENKTLRQTLKRCDQREKQFKKQQRIDKDKIVEMEEKLEEITNELHKYLKPNHNDYHNHNHNQQEIDVKVNLNETINELQYECTRWKSKYNKLLQRAKKVHYTLYTLFLSFVCNTRWFVLCCFVLVESVN